MGNFTSIVPISRNFVSGSTSDGWSTLSKTMEQIHNEAVYPTVPSDSGAIRKLLEVRTLRTLQEVLSDIWPIMVPIWIPDHLTQNKANSW